MESKIEKEEAIDSVKALMEMYQSGYLDGYIQGSKITIPHAVLNKRGGNRRKIFKRIMPFMLIAFEKRYIKPYKEKQWKQKQQRRIFF